MPVQIGQVLKNRYRIQSILGEGGMGTVYLAEDMLTDRPWAIKELYPDPLAGEAKLLASRLQFKQEAEALGKLRHRSLPHVSDYFNIDENDYLVMDYIVGESLADILKRKQRPTERLMYKWLEQILDAVEYCHQHGVLHRDIKPANIILTPEGRIMLVDFGLVKMNDPLHPRTATIVRGLGTPEYTPLEQYDASQGHTDERSDIYALGATLYHLLTGYAPQPVSQRILKPDTQPPIHKLNVKISPWMARFVHKSMAIRPEDRFQSVGEMRAELEQRLFKLKHESRPAAVMPPPEPMQQQYRRARHIKSQRQADTRRYLDEYRTKIAPVVMPMLLPVTVVTVLAVFVTVVMATGSAALAAVIIGPLVVGGALYHQVRRNRQGPPRY